MQAKKIKQLQHKLTHEQKRKLLVGLKKIKYERFENVGGETDIINQDNLQVAENEFTTRTGTESNAIAKTFDTPADFDSYVNQRRGIEITPKEMQSIVAETKIINELTTQKKDTVRIVKSITFRDENEGSNILADFLIKLQLQAQKPTAIDKYFLKYETTDPFGNNTTVIIKKLKESGALCWTAFSKYDQASQENEKEEDASGENLDNELDNDLKSDSDNSDTSKEKELPSL